MSEKIICEKCGAEMINYQEYGSCGMTCPICGWGWATTYSDPIDQDDTEYCIFVPPMEKPALSTIKSISKLCGSNFIETKQLLQSNGFSKSGKARAIRSCISTLRNADIAFTITPDYPYDLG